MLTQKTGQKKNLIYGAILGVILVIVAVLLLKNYVFTGSLKEEKSFLTPRKKTQAANIQVKKFDSDFLNDSRYKGLKDNSAQIKAITDLKIGKENPFAAD